MSLIFFEPIFKERIWGGVKLKTDFGFNIPNNHIGECWLVSAHPHGDTMVKNGEYKGLRLSELWDRYPNLFDNTTKRKFPIMIKIIDANDNLSVQVHPDNKLAELLENDCGKSECWYILDAKKDAQIIYGHTAKTKDEFKQKVLQNAWGELLIHRKVKKGDHIDVPAGTVHAIGSGVMVLEVQQSSDITYRIYDFERMDNNGNSRELHLEKSFAAITIPFAPSVESNDSFPLSPVAKFTPIVNNEYYSTSKLEVFGNLELKISAKYLIVTAINGSGKVNGYQVKKGDSFIIPNSMRKLIVNGHISLVVANES